MNLPLPRCAPCAVWDTYRAELGRAGALRYGTNERYGGVTLEWREAPFFPVTTYRAHSTNFLPRVPYGAHGLLS